MTQKDKIRNEYIRRAVGVANTSGKVTESRLMWFGCLRRRPGEHACRQIMHMEPFGRRGGRPRTRWMDAVDRDLEMVDWKRRWRDNGEQPPTVIAARQWQTTTNSHCGETMVNNHQQALWRDNGEQPPTVIVARQW